MAETEPGAECGPCSVGVGVLLEAPPVALASLHVCMRKYVHVGGVGVHTYQVAVLVTRKHVSQASKPQKRTRESRLSFAEAMVSRGKGQGFMTPAGLIKEKVFRVPSPWRGGQYLECEQVF